jgi:ABC-type proline/glycine betaine transport system permease subunit
MNTGDKLVVAGVVVIPATMTLLGLLMIPFCKNWDQFSSILAGVVFCGLIALTLGLITAGLLMRKERKI